LLLHLPLAMVAVVEAELAGNVEDSVMTVLVYV
jgi:hypothetical protein